MGNDNDEIAEARISAAADVLLEYWIDFSDGHIGAFRLAALIYDAMREAEDFTEHPENTSE